MKAIDLYSGIGGWTLGFKMAGITIETSYEWWEDANRTHNYNFGSNNKEINIRKLRPEDIPNPESIDFIIGSPPCTQFSFANRGGNGNIAEGLIDIFKFLEIVEYVNPKYWAMENVPRVAKILEKELDNGGSLSKFKYLFSDIKVFDSSEFGVPQKRKRMIAGRLPFDLLESYRPITQKLTLGDILEALNKERIVDPIYGIKLRKEELTDHVMESPLSKEEERLNKNAKSYHPVYNKMNFPDRWDVPSRTITALCTRVSRESIIIKDHLGNLRRLTVRERGCLQSFPVNFQFYSKSYGGKLKMIGNAIPPLLTFYIAQSMLEIPATKLVSPKEVPNQLIVPAEKPIIFNPDKIGSKYPKSRSFGQALPGLRFGSGIRFELKNKYNKQDKTTSWKINFYYGNSKNIKTRDLNGDLSKKICSITEDLNLFEIKVAIEDYISFCKRVDLKGLQDNWINKDKNKMGPLDLLDDIGKYVLRFKESINEHVIASNKIKDFIEIEFKNGEGKIVNHKLIESPNDIFIGLMVGSYFNSTVSTPPSELALL